MSDNMTTPYNAEQILDRRKMKRRLMFWRGLALVVAFLALIMPILSNDKLRAEWGLDDQIARVSISGLITDDDKRLKRLKKIAANKKVKAILLRINSPGGTTTGGEGLYVTLREIAGKTPIVSVFGTVATSAAYMTGIASDYIVARSNTITGSVGVIAQWAEVTEMLKKLGIEMNEIKSGSLKAVPSPFQKLDEEGRTFTQDMIAESHKWFVDLVVKRRSIDPDTIPGFMKGRIFSGRQALDYKLIDAIGGEETALVWLEKTHKISKNTVIVDWNIDQDLDRGFGGQSRNWIAEQLGGWFSGPLQTLFELINNSEHRLDGLISRWQPQK